MKFKQFLAILADQNGFVPTPQLRWVIRKNPRKTAREEAIAAEIIKKANPRECETGRFPWGPEEQMVLQQKWLHPESKPGQVVIHWRDVPIEGAEDLYSVEQTEHGPLPIPNAIKEPGVEIGDFPERLREVMGEDE